MPQIEKRFKQSPVRRKYIAEVLSMDRQSSGTILQYIRKIVRTDDGSEATDSQLLERFIASGDQDAFALLVRRHGPMVLGVCRRVLFHAQDVEDAFQATFMVLVRKARVIGRRELLANWLYGVAIRTAAKARANAARRRTREALVPDLPEAEAPGEPAWNSIQPVLDEEVGRLPTKYRAPFTLCYLQGLTNEEAALQLGCPKGTLQSRLAWARDRLRSRLTRRGVVLSAGLLATLLSEKTASAVVPCALADRTVAMALAFGGWKTAAGGTISAPAAHLAQGVLHAMFLAKLKIVAVIVLAGLLMGAGAGIWIRQAPAAEPLTEVFPDDTKPAQKERVKPRPNDGRFKAEAVTKKSFQTGAAPRVVVEMFNGPIEIKEGTNRKVDATVTKHSDALSQQEADDELENVEITMTQDGDTVHVKAKRKEERRMEHGGSGAWAELQVPPGAVLELHTSNGPVKIDGGKGNARVSTSNGGVRVQGRKGALHLNTSNGPIIVSGGAGEMDLTTSNGKIDIKADKAAVTGRTSNGSIRFEGTLAEGDHSLTTSNSNISIILPENARLKVDAATSNGTITSSFARGSQVRGGRLNWRGSIGEDPSSSLKLHTANGNIVIEKSKE
jgi:RNA polymerase sigma factor (sigma-70 family)